MSKIEQKLHELGLKLPEPPPKGGVYSPCKVFSGNLAYVSGCGPSTDGSVISGKLGAEFTLEEGKAFALGCMLNVLAVLKRETGTLDGVVPVKLLVFVASHNDFTLQPQVANGASELLVKLFGEDGAPARSAIGVNVLPGNIPVEVEALFEINVCIETTGGQNMGKQFPRTMVGGVSLPRMLIGSNWLLGYSHTSTAADKLIRETHSKRETTAAVIEAYLQYDIDAMMAPMTDELVGAVKLAEDRTGKKVILIDTPILNVDNNEAARAEARKVIENSRRLGSTFCFPHHSSAEQLVCKNTSTIDRLPDYLSMIRDNDMIPGLSAHMPELIVYSDLNEYDVQTYVQIYNCAGFLMQVEIEYIHKVIHNAKKPVMTIKAMAAGRVSPFVGITFSYATIRPCDMVTMGCYAPDEVHEDVEIALAAIERRAPDIEGRSSPKKTSIMVD